MAGLTGGCRLLRYGLQITPVKERRFLLNMAKVGVHGFGSLCLLHPVDLGYLRAYEMLEIVN